MLKRLPLLLVPALAGCAALQSQPPVTMAELRLAAYVADVQIPTAPAEMSEREMRIVAGICLGHRRVATPLDDVAAAYCEAVMSALPES